MELKETPLVSVIMPAYNGEKYILEAINSIMNQSYTNIELIVVEDCSSDRTREIIGDIHDQRIRVLYNDANRGIAFSTNRGISIARGKYIALQDDDDISEKNRIELQVEFLERHQEIDILGGGAKFIDEEGTVIRYGLVPRNNPKYIKAMLLFHNLDFVNTSVMYRKRFIEENKIFYEENCYGMQDYRFYIIASKIGNISSIGDFLVRHRVYSNSTTSITKKNNCINRAELYARFREESLCLSGYCIDDYELGVLNCALCEDRRSVSDFDEWKRVAQVFQTILKQAYEMEVEYYDELVVFTKKMMAKLLISFDFWGDEKIWN